jgi:hypothetical protein
MSPEGPSPDGPGSRPSFRVAASFAIQFEKWGHHRPLRREALRGGASTWFSLDMHRPLNGRELFMQRVRRRTIREKSIKAGERALHGGVR